MLSVIEGFRNVSTYEIPTRKLRMITGGLAVSLYEAELTKIVFNLFNVELKKG